MNETYFTKMSPGNCTNKEPVLGFQYEAQGLNVHKACFDEELEISNTYEESRKTKILLNYVVLSQKPSSEIKFKLFGVRYNDMNALTQIV